MNCSINRSSIGEITKVLNKNGKESKLYKQIAMHPLVNSMEDALNIYKSRYAEKFKDLDEDKITLSHQVNGQDVGSFKEALSSSQENQTIEIGFNIDGNFTSLISTTKNTNTSTVNGFIQANILNDVIAENRVRVGNTYKLQVEGKTQGRKVASLAVLRESAIPALGSKALNIDEFSFTLNKTLGVTSVYDKAGNKVETELDTLSEEEIRKDFDNADQIISERVYKQSIPVSRGKILVEKPKVKSEEEIKASLLNLLKKMGINVVSMTNYIKNYTTKNGVNPNAEALADIPNQVIAILEGRDTLENLTEETIHFIIEAIPQERLENPLRNIHKTEEYKQFAEIYREIYRNEYSGEELENVVRKEVFGKVALNAVQQNQEVSEQTQNFFTNAIRLITDFFNDIVNYFQPKYVQEFNSILADIQNVIDTQNTEDLDITNFASRNMRLYSVAPNQTAEGQLYRAVKLTLDSLIEQERVVRDTNIKSASNKAKLERIQADLNDAVQIESVSGLVLSARSRIEEIKAAIKESKSKNGETHLTVEEKVIFDSLTKNIQPQLSVIKTLIKDNKKGIKDWEALADMIDNVVLEIIDISAEAKTINNQNTARLVEELVDLHGVQNPELIRRWIDRVEVDTNLLMETFGQLSAARDGMLNLLGLVTRNMSNEGYVEFVHKGKGLQKVMSENGITEKDFKKFVDRGFIISKYDFPKFKAEMDAAFLKKYREYSKTTQSDEELIALRRERGLETFGDNQIQYERELKQEQDKLKERAFTDDYYKEYEEKMLKANISKATKDYLSGYFSGLADIKVKSVRTTNVNGVQQVITDQSILSMADRERLKELQQDRRMVKSYYDTKGSLKIGLAIKQENGVNVLVDGKLVFELLDNPTTDALVAFELNKLDSLNDYAGMSMNKGIPQKFIDELRNIENLFGREEAIDFLQMNSYTGFKSEYWDGLGTSKKVTEKLREVLRNDSTNEEIKDLINTIESKNAIVKNILKIFVNKNAPIEIDVERIPSDARDKVKALQEDLESLFLKAKKYTKDIVEEENTLQPFEAGVSSANQAWINLLVDSRLQIIEEGNAKKDVNILDTTTKILDLAKAHTTINNKEAIEAAVTSVRQYREGRSTGVTKAVKAELAKQGIEEVDLMDKSTYANFIIKYAENRLLPYYKRFSPASYNTFNDDLQDASDISEFVLNIPNRYPSLEITPNASYFEVQDNNNINPKFDTNFKGGYAQPNSSFRNKAFYDLFGDDKGTANPKLFKVYEAMMELRMDTLEANSAGRGYNAYMLPQTRKGLVEKFTNFLKTSPAQNAKNAIQDMFNFTEDEMVKGESFNSTLKMIPKMYLSEIEPTDVSTELFYSLMLSAKESYSRKSKIKHYGDVMSILDTMKARDYTATGKVADATRTMTMANAAVDYYMFGIKENSTAPIKTPFGTIDAAKVARNLLSYVKLKNLGFNIVIPFTSYATAKLNVFTETLIGQYLHKSSHKLGQAEYGRKAPDGMKELGKINTKSDINVYGQHYRSFDLDESFKNSNYGFLGRVIPRTSMALHAFANYPIYGANMYSVLHDFRFVDGKLVNFNQFRAQEKLKNSDKKTIEEKWNTLEDKVIYNYTRNNNGQFEYKETEIGAELNLSGDELKTEINKLNNAITNQLKAINEFIDGSISPEDRTAAQRDAYLSYLTTHKGWLTIATQRRFKGRHVNLETGLEEEGSYQSAWNFLGSYIKEYKDSGLSGVITNFRKAYEKADDVQRGNLIRVGKEMAVLNAVVALLVIMKSFADEPENESVYSLQLATYLLYRISSETTSSGLGIGSNYTEVIKAPIVGFDTVANLGNIIDLVPYVGDSEVTHGKYAGMTERAKFITTSFPGAKSVFDLYNINATRDTYNLYNEKNLNWTIGSSSFWADSEK